MRDEIKKASDQVVWLEALFISFHLIYYQTSRKPTIMMIPEPSKVEMSTKLAYILVIVSTIRSFFDGTPFSFFINLALYMQTKMIVNRIINEPVCSMMVR